MARRRRKTQPIGDGGDSNRRGSRQKASSKTNNEAESKAITPTTPKKTRGKRSLRNKKRDADDELPAFLTPSRAPSAAKQKQSPVIREIVVGNVSLVKLKKGPAYYRGIYWVYINNCPSLPGSRLSVNTDVKALESADPAQYMKYKIQDAIKKKAEELDLDMEDPTAKVYMESDWPWSNLWAAFENEMNKLKIEDLNRRVAAMKGAKTKSEHKVSADWVRGEEFKNADTKAYAKKLVLSELERACEKNMTRVESILSSIIVDCVKHGLTEHNLLSPLQRKRMSIFEDCTSNAKLAVDGLRRSGVKQSVHILTSFCAIMAPPSQESNKNAVFSRRQFCKLFGFNRNSKYLKMGIKNRRSFNNYLALKGEIKVGEKVCCRGSDDATLISLDNDGKVTIQLHPYETTKTYTSAARASMIRYIPRLDGYSREIRCDLTPEHHCRIIECFFRRNVPESPNTKDTEKKRHPIFRSQVIEKRRLVRYQTWQELWVDFGKQHPEVYEKYKSETDELIVPRVFRENAPFEMTKAHDIGCACIDCEGMQSLMLGCVVAIPIIVEVMRMMKLMPTSDARKRQISQLERVEDILSTNSKYDTIVKCLSPCLPPDGKLEAAEYACINGTECMSCGMRQVWSMGVRDEVNALVQAGHVELIKKCHWRHYTQSAAKAIVDKDGEEEYTPTTASDTRAIVLENTSGDVVEYLDLFEKTTEKHAYH